MSEEEQTKKPSEQDPKVENWDGFPDDEEVFDRIWEEARRKGFKADPVHKPTQREREQP